jgi:signal peptidase I
MRTGTGLHLVPAKVSFETIPWSGLSDREYFVLGDNRDDSADSREFGPVSEELVLGKAIATFETGDRIR